MRKEEIMTLLQENNVTSRNLLTFIGKQKESKKLRSKVDKIYKWLEDEKEEERIRMEKMEVKEEAIRFKMSIREYETLRLKASTILNDFRSGHSMGDTKTLYVDGKVFLIKFNSKADTPGYSYIAQHGNFEIVLSKRELRDIHRDEYLNWVYRRKQLRESGRFSSYIVELT